MSTLQEAPQSVDALIESMGQKARQAALTLATLPTETKNRVLDTLAQALVAQTDALLKANAQDLAAAAEAGLAKPMVERLTFTPERIQKMADGVIEVRDLPDPVGEILHETVRPNGIRIEKVRVPMGVIGIIYESRPNVTIDCAILCFKSGNAAILRGGKEAIHTNSALAVIIQEALRANAVTEDAVQIVPTADRAALNALIKLDTYVQCIIPRGGEGLIRFVSENGTVPVIKHYKGVCTVYLDKDADTAMAESITVNAKCQRPSVCNAAENLLVHAEIADALLPQVGAALATGGVELRADDRARAILQKAGIQASAAAEADWAEEFLDLILAVKVVDSVEEGIQFINTYGSAHSDAIVTRNEAAAQQFLNGVDSATVYWNASTRFTDGFEFGMGAEIGISTDRLHARGPMGLPELCSYKFRVTGTGQIK